MVDVENPVSTIVPYCEIDKGNLCSHPPSISTLTGKTTVKEEDLVYEVIPGEN